MPVPTITTFPAGAIVALVQPASCRHSHFVALDAYMPAEDPESMSQKAVCCYCDSPAILLPAEARMLNVGQLSDLLTDLKACIKNVISHIDAHFSQRSVKHRCNPQPWWTEQLRHMSSLATLLLDRMTAVTVAIDTLQASNP